MRRRLLLGAGLAALAVGTAAAAWPGPAAGAGPVAAAAGTATARPAAPQSVTRPGRASACAAFPGARQLPGAGTVQPAAWSGGGLVVPACGPVPGAGAHAAAVTPYPGGPSMDGYQCVELALRYLYQRFGLTMDAPTNGDQVAAHYASDYAALFTLVANGTPHRAPAPGDVISLSTVPGFDSASGGHSVVVQSSVVDEDGNGTVTVIEENASASGVTVVPVDRWHVRYPGFRYADWLTTIARPRR